MQTPSLFQAAAAPHAAPSAPGPLAPTFSDQVQHLVAGGPQAWMPLLTGLGRLAINVAVAGLILLITFWIAGWASRFARDATGRFHRHDEPDTVLQGFIASVVRYAVWIVGGIAVLQQLGVQTTSVLAVLGAASLAIGLALQGALANVAAGVMILILRPYRVGDRVVIDGREGTVRGLDLFITRLHDLDNSVVFIPNAKALGDKIVNYTMTDNRRIVMDFGIDYADDVDLALALLIETAEADERIVANPAPWAKLTKLGDSTVTVTLRAWTSPDGYVDTRFDLIKAVKARFEAAGLTFAYPHQVAVETRPWTAPDQARQRAELKRLGAAGQETSADSAPTGDPSSGSASEVT
jgi:small conductance mechanosensitive channel